MSEPINNLRIRFYGVQGSGSTFPSAKEIDDLIAHTDYELLKAVLQDISERSGMDRSFECSVPEIIGGPTDKQTILAYRNRLNIPPPRIYGGWTTCFHIETSDGYDIVIDCGSGFRNCAKELEKKWGDAGERHLYILGSHSHSDHTEGFDQAAVCFNPRNRIRIYANYQYLYALDSYLGIFSKYVEEDVAGVKTPIDFSIMPAEFTAVEIRDPSKPFKNGKGGFAAAEIHEVNTPIAIGETRITPFEVYHPAPCLAYKFEHKGKTFVFCTDHELRHGPNPEDPRQKASEAAEARLAENAHGADALYRDGQFLRSDYEGRTGIGSSAAVSRIDWGHSCIEDVKKMARRCHVKRAFIGHHDPNREWSDLNWIDESLLRDSEDEESKVELARGGFVLDL